MQLQGAVLQGAHPASGANKHRQTMSSTVLFDLMLKGGNTLPEKLERRQSFQTIAWFRDLYKRELLELDPPYQRRSVWNQKYRDFFIETVLLQYPAPAIFVYEVISPEGAARYSIVDGKQRLDTIFKFADDLFPVSNDSALTRLQGQYFSSLDDETKKQFWTYQFSVEFLPTVEEGTLINVFDRINRNVARLTRQELRHARFDGRFATLVETLAEYLELKLPEMPRIAFSSKSQMRDIELIAQLVLLIENGPQSFSQDDLDQAYSDRDDEWDFEAVADTAFRRVIDYIAQMTSNQEYPIQGTRLRNQADFYSLFGAIASLEAADSLPDPSEATARLYKFVQSIADGEGDEIDGGPSQRYLSAARSASNDLRQRNARIEILKEIILDNSPD